MMMMKVSSLKGGEYLQYDHLILVLCFKLIYIT